MNHGYKELKKLLRVFKEMTVEEYVQLHNTVGSNSFEIIIEEEVESIVTYSESKVMTISDYFNNKYYAIEIINSGENKIDVRTLPRAA